MSRGMQIAALGSKVAYEKLSATAGRFPESNEMSCPFLGPRVRKP
jgi:hypothetical protein